MNKDSRSQFNLCITNVHLFLYPNKCKRLNVMRRISFIIVQAGTGKIWKDHGMLINPPSQLIFIIPRYLYTLNAFHENIICILYAAIAGRL